MKKIALLGASGSIGLQTLEVIEHHQEQFSLVAFSVGKKVELIDKIVQIHQPKLISVQEEASAIVFSKKYPSIEFVFGEDGLMRIARLSDYDLLVNALVGFVGLMPTLKAIECKKDIALANKESLVVAGEFVMNACKEHQVKLLPIDSEHSAIFQVLQGNDKQSIHKLLLTASGGSFRDLKRAELQSVSKRDALNHPNWSMGAKITIDSATMMNKGFEVIEAHWLFDVDYKDIIVLLHRESIIHSMVEFVDKSVIAQLGIPDMKLPIQYALSYPERLPLDQISSFNFEELVSLQLEPIDYQRYPLLQLAFKAGELKGNLPAIMNAANEVAVAAFLNDEISFLDIEYFVMDACEHLEYKKDVIIEDIFLSDKLAREYVKKKIKGE